MKKTFMLPILSALLLGVSTSASAFFWDDDNDWKCWGPMGPYGPEIPDCNPYDEWDPRYWMEEFEQTWDDDDDYMYYGGYGRGPWGMPYGGGAPMMPYGGAPMMPYGGGAPYGAPAPMPYGGPSQMVPPAPPAAPVPNR